MPLMNQCEECEKPFKPLKGSKGRFCSKPCFYKWDRPRLQELIKKLHDDMELECVTCKKIFIANSCAAKYCSDRCRGWKKCRVCPNEIHQGRFKSNAEFAKVQTCSNKCSGINKTHPLKENTCKNCGNKFRTKKRRKTCCNRSDFTLDELKEALNTHGGAARLARKHNVHAALVSRAFKKHGLK